MTDKPHTGDPASLAGQRAHTMPGQRVVNLLVRGLMRTASQIATTFISHGLAVHEQSG